MLRIYKVRIFSLKKTFVIKPCNIGISYGRKSNDDQIAYLNYRSIAAKGRRDQDEWK